MAAPAAAIALAIASLFSTFNANANARARSDGKVQCMALRHLQPSTLKTTSPSGFRHAGVIRYGNADYRVRCRFG